MNNRIIIKTEEKTASMEQFYGVFFEDISNAADGGLYAELIQNRSFEFCPMDNPGYNALTAWEKVEEGESRVSYCVMDKEPLVKKNPHYLVMDFEKVCGKAGIRNLGYFTGVPIEKEKEYRLCFYAKSKFPLPMYVAIESGESREYIRQEFQIDQPEWKRYEFRFIADFTDYESRLMIGAEKEGKMCLDFVSLFPTDTFKNRENGLRKDLAQMIADLGPRFMRFPGGCLIHVGSLNEDDRDAMYRWKNTLGRLEERPSKAAKWRGNQTFGLGYLEYFQFCEDIGAEPIPVLPAGYNPHTGMGVPLDEMQPWIDDALDLIEFANGNTDTAWGAKRALLGHPEPFGLKYLAIGNEEEGQGFWDRYDLFHKAIREKYPQIKVINNASFSMEGEDYERGWKNALKNHSDLIDEHYYMSPEWFIENCHHYDSFERKGPNIFLGEYSSRGNTYFNALAEAAYMLHLENNADLVKLVCYAPLLCNVHNPQWVANLIYFDQYRLFGTPNYYVQKLFMNNCGTRLLQTKKVGLNRQMKVVVPALLQEKSKKEDIPSDEKTVFAEELYYSASMDEKDGSILVKVVNVSAEVVEAELYFENCNTLSGTLYEMKGYDKLAQNSLEQPEAVIPVEKKITIKQAFINCAFAPESITVFRLYKKESENI